MVLCMSMLRKFDSDCISGVMCNTCHRLLSYESIHFLERLSDPFNEKKSSVCCSIWPIASSSNDIKYHQATINDFCHGSGAHILIHDSQADLSDPVIQTKVGVLDPQPYPCHSRCVVIVIPWFTTSLRRLTNLSIQSTVQNHIDSLKRSSSV